MFAAIIGLASDCNAQHHRGLFKRGSRVQHLAPGNNAGQSESPAVHDQSSVYPQQEPQIQNDWRRDPSYFSAPEAYPKYYGGFHYSQFYNLGLPPGDIGFRGNGIYWNPW